MKKTNSHWTIAKLQEHYENIEFPEFQREPTVWKLDKKRLLIDSIFRGLDIATIYLHQTDGKNGSRRYECIDGRQRINAILSYLGLNEADDGDELDNGFILRSSNEISLGDILRDVDGRTFEDLRNDPDTKRDREFLKYEFNVLEISKVENDEELNLMFLRLQGGQGLNPGEKLRAMKGDMRDFVFGYNGAQGIGSHRFFAFLNIPKRRYAREQVAVQVVMNYFSKARSMGFQRARFVDLQEFLGDFVRMSKEDLRLADELKERVDEVYEYVSEAPGLVLKNRALGVTTFFFINELISKDDENLIEAFLEFLKEFLGTLKVQVEKGIDIDPKYRDLLRFQTYVSQAAVERYAIENRQAFLEEYFEYYLETDGKIKTRRD